MRAKVLNPAPKKRKTTKRKKETVAQRKKRMAKVRSYKTTAKRKPVKRKTVKRKVTRKNPLSPQMKRAHSFISKIIIALESGHKVELEKKDLTSFRYILKNL